MWNWKGPKKEKNPSNPRLRTAGHPQCLVGATLSSPPGGMDFFLKLKYFFYFNLGRACNWSQSVMDLSACDSKRNYNDVTEFTRLLVLQKIFAKFIFEKNLAHKIFNSKIARYTVLIGCIAITLHWICINHPGLVTTRICSRLLACKVLLNFFDIFSYVKACKTFDWELLNQL